MTISTKNLALRVTRKGFALINFKRLWATGLGTRQFEQDLKEELGELER